MNDTRERVLLAAREAFLEGGIGATRMEAVAAKVGIARPNVYRYFGSKQELVKHVILREVAEVNEQRRARLPIRGSARDLIVESLLRGADLIAGEGLLAVSLTRDADQVTSVLVSEDDDLLTVQLAYWQPVLDHGRDRGEIREDLDDARIVRWFMANDVNFTTRPEMFPGDLRGWVEDFVVPPVLA